MKYLMIDEDGGVEQTNNEPDQELLERINGAGFQMFRYESGIFEQAIAELAETADGEDDRYEISWEAV